MDRQLWRGERWVPWKRAGGEPGGPGAGGRIPRRLERGTPGRPGFVLGWVGWMLALFLTLPASGQQDFMCELPYGGSRSRVFAGEDVSHDDYPWQVAVIKRVSPDPPDFCGGSLIDAEWVLTAAHCLTIDRLGGVQKGFARPDQLEIRHGTTNWREAPTHGVAKVVIHPEYKHYRKGNDIALLHLSSPIENSKRSYAIGLVSPKNFQHFVFPGACAVVSGWGRVSNEKKANVVDELQAASLAVLQECSPPYYGGPPEAVICAGQPGLPDGGRDSCEGDSGGPLVVEGLGPGHFILAGVTSFGPRDCGTEGSPGVYTRVSYHREWIEQTIGGK